MKVICISGKARHGKDTVAEIMRSWLIHAGKRVLVIHNADLLKFVCEKYFGWNGKKDESGRTLLQYVGTDVIRKQNPDYWVGFITQILGFFKDEWDYVLIPDCRFPNEITHLVINGFDVEHVRVFRPGLESELTQQQQNHPSETALDNFPVDHILVNDSSYRHLSGLVAALPFMPCPDSVSHDPSVAVNSRRYAEYESFEGGTNGY